MRIGRIQITRLGKDKLGRPLHPWEEVTLDQLSTEARLLIQKMARVAAKDHFEETRENSLALLDRSLEKHAEGYLRDRSRRIMEQELPGLVTDLVERKLSEYVRSDSAAERTTADQLGWITCPECGNHSNAEHRFMCRGPVAISGTMNVQPCASEAEPQPAGRCVLCHAPWSEQDKWAHVTGNRWVHADSTACVTYQENMDEMRDITQEAGE